MYLFNSIALTTGTFPIICLTLQSLLSCVNCRILLLTYVMQGLTNASSIPLVFSSMWQCFLLLAVAVDRFVAVTRPLHYVQLVTKSRIVVVAVGTGLSSLVYASIILAVPSKSFLQVVCEAGADDVTINDMYGPALDGYLTVWLCLILLMGCIVVLLYIPVLAAIRKQRRAIHQQLAAQGHIPNLPPGTNQPPESLSHKGTIMLCAAMVYFVISFVPMLIFLWHPYLRSLSVTSQELLLWDILVKFFSFSSCIINPFFYGLNLKTCKRLN